MANFVASHASAGLLALIFLASTAFGAQAHDQLQCTDIRTADLRNSTLTIGTEPNQKTFQLRDGKYTEYLTPGDDAETQSSTREARTAEWEATIEEEIIVYPVAEIPIRFLFIEDDHLRGSGSNSYMAGYGCFDGSLKQVFVRAAPLIRIDHMDSHQLSIIVFPIYRSDKYKKEVYVWDAATSVYMHDSAHTGD